MSISSNRFSSRVLRFLASASALLAFGGQVACTTLDSTIANIDGRDIEVVDVGAGNPTVVFESGWGNDWASWDDVASEVSGQTRVFAYSRPGYGDSDPTTAPRTATRIVEDLRVLLTAQNVAPPYILVGHSFGGTYMELFAKAHPDEVAGLVLVDTRHRDFTTACQDAGLGAECSVPASTVDSLSDVERDEYRAFGNASAEIHDAGNFGAYPVRVLTATSHHFSTKAEALWVSIQSSLANEAPDGKQVCYPGAGHLLQVDQPHEVASVILSLVPAAKN